MANYQPVMGDFNADGSLNKLWGPNGKTLSVVGAKLLRAAASAAASNVEINALASGVTQTVGTVLDAALTVNFATLASLSRIRTYGGIPAANTSSNRAFYPVASSFPETAGNLSGTLLSGRNDYQAWAWGAGIRTDSHKVAFQMFGFTSRNFRVIVDDGSGPRYVNATGAAYSANNAINYVTIDFAGVYKTRDIYIEGDRNCGLYGVWILPTCDLAQPSPRERITALVTGDSYSESQGASWPWAGWAPTVGKLLGWTDVRQVAVGSTGYIEDGSTRQPVIQQIPRWLQINSDLQPSDVDVIVCASGYNDWTRVNGGTNTAADVGNAAAATLSAIRGSFPSSLILVPGPWGGAKGPGSVIQAIESAVSAAVGALSDRMTKFIPVSTATAPWIFGTGRVGATNSTGNSDRVISSDGTHPGDFGHRVIADRFTEAYMPIIRDI